jgi:putative acetyltransferase
MQVRQIDPAEPQARALVAAHVAHCHGLSPPESCHALGADGLSGPDILLLGAFEGDRLEGIGALKIGPFGEGEIKSMHTRAKSRGRGVGAAILDALIAAATARGLRVLRLETGSTADFAAARALYARRGFAAIGPFGPYRADPLSAFFELDLAETPCPSPL